jgi:Carbohydrate esterase, sialic acid-specific acetylesterase
VTGAPRRLAVILTTMGIVLFTGAGIASGTASARPAPAAPRIVILAPRDYQVVQRTARGLGTITVRGKARGFGGPVRVRWGDGPWHTVPRARDGSFTGSLTAQPAGQATLYVRSARVRHVRATRLHVGVGDIYVIAGQSNASGRSTTLFSCTDPVLRATEFGNDYRWHRLTDPVDSPAGQVDGVSRDAAGGSVWPLVAQELMKQEPVPVAFVPCARVGSNIARWRRSASAPDAPSTLYGSMLRRIHAVGGRVRAVLFWQGEADAKKFTPGDLYEALLRQLGLDLRRDCRAPLVVAQIGDFGPHFDAAAVDAVRLAQARAWGEANVVAGPVLYDIDLEGIVHFSAPDDVELAARRWTAAILGGVLGREAGVTPRLQRAVWDGDRTIDIATGPGTVALTPGLAGGFTVHSGGEEVPLESATAEAGGLVRLVLAAPPAGPLTVSLGEGRTGAGAAVPTDASAWRLPMLPFVAEPVADAP